MATLDLVGVDTTTGEYKIAESGDTVNNPAISGGGAFTSLSDVPASYSGGALKIVRVNAVETGLEFATISGSGLTQMQVEGLI